MDKKMTGILSLYYKNLNCGGQLQAYALCKALQKGQYAVEQIGYKQQWVTVKKSVIQKLLGTFKKYKNPVKFIKAVKGVLDTKIINFYTQKLGIKEKRLKSYEKFSNIIPHGVNVYTKETIKDCIDKYSTFIVGSDQIWHYSSELESYTLSFVPAGRKKIAYAASITKNQLSEREKEIFRNNLKDFKAVSVREKEAVDLLQPLCPTKIEWVLAPTMLLSTEDWDEVCEERIVPEEYVFCYFLGADKKRKKTCDGICQEKRLKARYVYPSSQSLRRVGCAFRRYSNL